MLQRVLLAVWLRLMILTGFGGLNQQWKWGGGSIDAESCPFVEQGCGVTCHRMTFIRHTSKRLGKCCEIHLGRLWSNHHMKFGFCVRDRMVWSVRFCDWVPNEFFDSSVEVAEEHLKFSERMIKRPLEISVTPHYHRQEVGPLCFALSNRTARQCFRNSQENGRMNLVKVSEIWWYNVHFMFVFWYLTM